MSNKVEQFTPSAVNERIEDLKEMFPDVFTEGKLDVSKFREALGEEVEEESERYRFTWAGKRKRDSVTSNPYAGNPDSMPR